MRTEERLFLRRLAAYISLKEDQFPPSLVDGANALLAKPQTPTKR